MLSDRDLRWPYSALSATLFFYVHSLIISLNLVVTVRFLCVFSLFKRLNWICLCNCVWLCVIKLDLVLFRAFCDEIDGLGLLFDWIRVFCVSCVCICGGIWLLFWFWFGVGWIVSVSYVQLCTEWEVRGIRRIQWGLGRRRGWLMCWVMRMIRRLVVFWFSVVCFTSWFWNVWLKWVLIAVVVLLLGFVLV